jgi:cell wall-associated NlpC family hydrolase
VAFRLSRRFRTAGIAGVLLAAALTVPTVAFAAPHSSPAPAQTIDSVQQQLGKLALKNDQLVEQYNQANNAYHATKIAAAKASKGYRAAARKLATARGQLSASATAQYEGGSFSAAGALLSSDSGSSYLDQLDTLSMLSSHNAQVVSSYAATQKQAKDAKKSADHLLNRARTTRQKLAKQHTNTQQQINKYTTLLASLNAQQRAAWAKRANPTVSATQISQVKTVHITSAAVKKAVSFALAQVGKPYVWGAAGPSSYDCSGLTMASYQAAGISLPHSAQNQYNYGHHVASTNLQPGDLMFFYQPIGHVTMYIGDGMMVSAPETGEDVKVIPATTFGSDYTGATRLVG